MWSKESLQVLVFVRRVCFGPDEVEEANKLGGIGFGNLETWLGLCRNELLELAGQPEEGSELGRVSNDGGWLVDQTEEVAAD